ncbi:MAG: hypothetical protein ABSE73_12850, partial [Planctomycetota bacterium]
MFHNGVMGAALVAGVLCMSGTLANKCAAQAADAGRLALDRGQWQVTFDEAASELACQHRGSGARLRGALSFEELAAGRSVAWTVRLPRDPVAG